MHPATALWPVAAGDLELLERGAGSVGPYKRHPREVGESGAAVGAAHITEEAGQCPWMGRGRTWSAGSREVSAGECPSG